MRTISPRSRPRRAAYVQAFASSLDTVFFLAAIVAAVGFVLTLLLPEHPLRRTVAAVAGDAGDEMAGAFARPAATASDDELRRGLAIFANRDVQRAHVAQIVARAGLSLTPGAAWLLVRIEHEPALNLAVLGEEHQVSADRLMSIRDELERAGLIAQTAPGERGPWRLTVVGCDALARLIDARRAHLADLIAEWPVEQREGVARELQRIAERLVPGLARDRASAA